VRGEQLHPVFQVQRSAGNAAAVEYVRRIKGGEGLGESIGAMTTAPTLQRDATRTKRKAPPKRIVLTSGKEIDAFLAASSFFGRYTKGKMKEGTSAEKSFKFHDEEEFKKRWVAYAVGNENPETGKPFTKEEAEAKRVTAFLIPEKKEIHLNKKWAGQEVKLHETLHLFSDESAWINVVGYNVNEGATEFFREILCAETNMPFNTNFSRQHASVTKLVAISSKEALAAAYFEGKLEGIRSAVEAKGEGRWARWLRSMEQGKYAEADALLK
jgi:hypothetical protein